VHVSTLTNDYYQFDPLHQQLIGENFRRRYRLGDKVRVKVMGVNLDDRKIDFVMVEEPSRHRQERQGDGAQAGRDQEREGQERPAPRETQRGQGER
jgi:ribonuclease R